MNQGGARNRRCQSPFVATAAKRSVRQKCGRRLQPREQRKFRGAPAVRPARFTGFGLQIDRPIKDRFQGLVPLFAPIDLEARLAQPVHEMLYKFRVGGKPGRRLRPRRSRHIRREIEKC